MAGKLTYSIAVNMITDGIKKGAASFKNELQSMQYKTLAFIGALGFGGIGLGNFTSKLIETARETNRANTALKNISGGMEGFTKNQKFLLDLSAKYGIEINSLTGSYAKFSAAANAANMPMADQQKIFESMSRASTAFGLSSDEANLSFLAITQMMSKGKISSEELRRQLGEKMPVAMAAMAKAAGVPINKLDKLLQQGKLMSADILPKFADALNDLIPTVNTDNLETSLNRMKNAFTAFTAGTGISTAYKTVVDEITTAIETGAKNIRTIVSTTISLIIALVGGKLWTVVSTYFASVSTLMKSYAGQAEAAEAQVLMATAKRVQAQEVLELAQANFEASTGAERLKAKKQLNAAILALDTAKAAEQRALVIQTETVEKAAQMGSLSRWGRFTVTIGSALKKMAGVAKTAFMSMLPALVIFGISTLVSKIIEATRRAKELREAQGGYKNAGTSNAEYRNFVNNKKLAEDTTLTLRERKTALDQLNSIMGTNYKINEKTLKIEGDINQKYAERLKLIEQEQRVKYLSDKKITSEESLNKAAKAYTKDDENTINKYGKRATNVYKFGSAEQQALFEIRTGYTAALNRMNAYVAAKAEDDNLGKALNKAQSYLPKAASPAAGGGGGGDETKTALQQAEKAYTEKRTQYANQLANKVIQEAEYNKLMDDLNKETVKAIGGLIDEKTAAKNKIFLEAKAGVANPLTTKAKEADTKYIEEKTKYTDALAVLNRRKELELVTSEDYTKELNNLIDTTIENILSIDNIGTAADAFVKAINATKIPDLKKFRTPDLSKNDTFFDYKRTDSEKLGGRIDSNLDNIDKIAEAFNKIGIEDVERKINEAGDNLTTLRSLFSGETRGMFDMLTELMKETPDLQKALKILEVKQDIKDLNQLLAEGLYTNLRGIGATARSIRDAFQQMKDVMKDPESDGWDKFFSSWDAIFSILDGIIGTVQAISSMIEVMNKLKEAKAAATPAEMAHALAVVGANTLITTSESAKAASTAANAAVMVPANKAASASFTELMAAQTAAAYASIPFAGPGLALAQIGVLKAAIVAAGIPQFANGGIVGGNSRTGDKILARVNSGEMILNTDQQSTLWGQMNKGATKLSGDIKIQGSDIYLSLKNYLKQSGNKL